MNVGNNFTVDLSFLFQISSANLVFVFLNLTASVFPLVRFFGVYAVMHIDLLSQLSLPDFVGSSRELYK